MAPSGEKRSAGLSKWFQRFSGKSPSTSSYYTAEPPLGESRSNRSQNQNKLKNQRWSDEDEQMRKTMCFAAVLIGNLVVLGCLLLAWNANAVSNVSFKLWIEAEPRSLLNKKICNTSGCRFCIMKSWHVHILKISYITVI